MNEHDSIPTENTIPDKADDKDLSRKMEVYLKHLEKHMDKSKDRYEYAVKQFDTLMIALSTAGLGFVATFIKGMEGNLYLAYVAQLFFLLCFFANLISHLASMRCNKAAMLNAKDEFEAEVYESYKDDQDGKIKHEITLDRRRREIGIFAKIVRVLNVLAFIFLSTAVICFITFAYKT